MIKKIEEPGDFDRVKKGTILTKYPLSGDYSEKIDFTDNRNLLHYEVHTIDSDAQRLMLKFASNETPSTGELIPGYNVSADGPPEVDKSFAEIIEAKIWWYEQ